jgi:hypothetical protein
VGSGEFEAFRAELPSLTSLDLTATGCNWSPRRLPALQELHLRGLVYLNPSVAPVLRTLELCGFPKGDHVEVLRQCSRLTALGLLLPKREPEPLRALLEAKLPLTAVDLLADRDAERIWPVLHQVGRAALFDSLPRSSLAQPIAVRAICHCSAGSVSLFFCCCYWLQFPTLTSLGVLESGALRSLDYAAVIQGFQGRLKRLKLMVQRSVRISSSASGVRGAELVVSWMCMSMCSTRRDADCETLVAAHDSGLQVRVLVCRISSVELQLHHLIALQIEFVDHCRLPGVSVLGPAIWSIEPVKAYLAGGQSGATAAGVPAAFVRKGRDASVRR